MIRYLRRGNESSVWRGKGLTTRAVSSRLEQTGHCLRGSLDTFDFVRLERLRLPVNALFSGQQTRKS